MRYIKVIILVLIFFFFAIFVVQNHGVLGQNIAFRLNLFAVPPLESVPLPLYFILLISLVLGALVCVLFLAGDRVKMTFALHRANKRINVLEQEVAQLRAIPLTTGNSYRPAPEKEEAGSLFSGSVGVVPASVVTGKAPDEEPKQAVLETGQEEEKNKSGDKDSGTVDKL